MSERPSPFHVVRSAPRDASPLETARAAATASQQVARVALAEVMSRLEVDRADLAGIAELESLPAGIRDAAKRLAKHIEGEALALTQLAARN